MAETETDAYVVPGAVPESVLEAVALVINLTPPGFKAEVGVPPGPTRLTESVADVIVIIVLTAPGAVKAAMDIAERIKKHLKDRRDQGDAETPQKAVLFDSDGETVITEVDAGE
jgi:hypothetical protein